MSTALPAAPSPEPRPQAARRRWRGVALFAAAVVLVGLAARLRAAAFPAHEMFRSFPSEDGYLMLTVARNVALGRGMSSAAGTLPTNGVQPLATLVQALCFRLVGGDRARGVRLLIVVYTGVALLTAALIYRLGLRLGGGAESARPAALLAAGAWFASPATLFHSMNMLETGPYAAAVTGVALFFARGHARAGMPWPWLRSAGLGALLGAAFWTRNDAVFLMAAVGLAHLATASGALRRRRGAAVLVMAAAAAAASLPWLVHNVVRFGSVVPVSGRAYLGGADVGANARAAAVALFEHANLVAAFEFNPIQRWPPFVAACAAALALAAAVGVRLVARSKGDQSLTALLVLPAAFAAGLLGFYVLLFDAPHFLRRYLFPLSPFLALAWGFAAAAVWRRAAASRLRAAGVVGLALLVANFVLRDALLVRGPWQRSALFRSVDWVDAHLTDETWVGAFQSGTLGFFHDRTINLDGKVNPEALAAIDRQALPAYVVGSPVQLVVDWASILEPWSRSDPAVLRSFEWVVRDPRGNFAVLSRRGAPRGAPLVGGG